MTPKVDDVYIIFQQLTTFLHEKEAKDIKEDGEHVTRVFKDLFERVNKFDSLNVSMYPITDAFEKIEITKKTTCKLSESINDLKNNLKRRDFRKFMIYVNVFLCLGVIRKEIFIQIYNSFKMCTWSKYERQIEKYSESIQHLYGIEKERDRELLSTFVKTESKSAVVNFMYNACDWLLVDRVLANSYSCRELTEDGSFVPTDSEYTIECAAFIGSKAYMANLWGSFLILSRHENLQSRFKFTQKDIAGKKFFTIYSNLWPSYHVKMRLGKVTGWCVHGKHDDPHDSGTWSIRAVKYRDDTFYLLSPRKSKAVFMCADMSGRIYGNMKQVDAYCLWSIKQVKTR